MCFFCKDDFLLIESEKQFCSLETKNERYYKEYIKKLPKAKNYNYSVTLEIMEYYNKGSIKSLKDISHTKFARILLQLIFCQLNLFGKVGYTHNDIHEGNILIKKHTTEQIFNYKYIITNCVDASNEYNLKNNYEYILSDYDKVFHFRKDFFDRYYGDIDSEMDTQRFLEYSLYSNLLSTIKMLIEKLNKDDKILILNKLYDVQNKYEKKILRKNKQLIITYSKDYDFDKFRKEMLIINCYFIKKFIESLKI